MKGVKFDSIYQPYDCCGNPSESILDWQNGSIELKDSQNSSPKDTED